jgi:2-polyprenyl-3-methyl-5-hydroxy-6-metoxy-1,4-benzoquinol methylase
MIKRIYGKLKRILTPRITRFDSTGERVDIIYNKKIDFKTLDMFQKSHFKRYEYALDIIGVSDVCGDFACGTGYGAVMLSKKATKVIGADINAEVVAAIQKRYRTNKKVRFINANLLDLSFDAEFDVIISFETIEHFTEEDILKLLQIFGKGLKPGGKLVISTPYMQERSEAALKLGHHFTFYIDEKVIINWLSAAGFDILSFKYQNYDSHIIEDHLNQKDFLICVAEKRR